MTDENKMLGSDNLVARQYLRPELAKRIEGGDSTVSQLADAHENYRNFYHSMTAAMKQKDPTVTDDGHFLEMRDLALKTVQKAADVNAKALASATQEVEFTRTALKQKLGLTEDHRASEIRGYLRSLDEQERASVAQAAVSAGDSKTIAAIVDSPAYLSGFSAKALAGLKAQYESQHGGDLPARIRDLELAISINSKTSDDALAFLDRLLPHERFKAIEKNREVAKAMREKLGA